MSFFLPTAATGNGRSLATLGASGEIMGFFYPRIDFAQNVREAMPAIRLADRQGGQAFLWNFADCWRVDQSFEPSANVLLTHLFHRGMDLNIEFRDLLPPGEGALLRRVVINKGAQVGPVQFMHYFRLRVGDVENRNGVQAYPEDGVVVQHARDLALAVSATQPFSAQCGTVTGEQESSTKQAMRTGALGSSLQSIGQVDFAIGFKPIDGDQGQAVLVLAGGNTQASAIASAKRVAEQGFDAAVRSANKRVMTELAGAGPCPVTELARAYERAVISLHDLFDDTEGTFIAAPEFDPAYELSGGYGYCWPRDAAVCSLAMQQIGQPDKAHRFFEWSARTQLNNGHWYQRYWTHGSPAPSWCVRENEIQLDQTCGIVHAAGRFARGLQEPDAGSARSFVEFYRPVVQRATRAMLEHLGEDGLHRSATDLWENSVGTFAYTQAGLIAALREADEVFGVEPERAGHPARVRLRSRLLDVFWNPDRKRWLRGLTVEGQPDPTLDSSPMGMIEPWQLLDLQDPNERRLAEETLDGISTDLRSPVKGGGAILRFDGESYMGGGPGCVNTLWLALCRLRLAATAHTPIQQDQQRTRAMDDLRIAVANSSPTGQLPELIPKVGFEYWAAPHAWACSLLIQSVSLLRSLSPSSPTALGVERAQVQPRAPSH